MFVNLGVGRKSEMTKVALCWYFSVYVIGNICADLLIHWFQVPRLNDHSLKLCVCLKCKLISGFVPLA